MKLEKKLPLVTRQQAIELKRLGFDWDVEYYYDLKHTTDNSILSGGSFNFNSKEYIHSGRDISAPTLEIALKWLREKKGAHLIPQPIWNPSGLIYHCYLTFLKDNKLIKVILTDMTITNSKPNEYKSYELAQYGGLDFIIKSIN